MPYHTPALGVVYGLFKCVPYLGFRRGNFHLRPIHVGDPMSGWNLPPGCTDNDIEVAQGAAAYCERCGQFYVIGEKDTELCPQCEGEENE